MTPYNDTKILLALAYDKITQIVKLTHILSVAEVRSIALNIIFIQLVRPDTFTLCSQNVQFITKHIASYICCFYHIT